MTDEERNHYFGVLVEDLYTQVKTILNEGPKETREEIAKKLIMSFYNDNKDEYNLNSVEDVMTELDRVEKDIKKNEQEGLDER